jgi:hypothetical protein
MPSHLTFLNMMALIFDGALCVVFRNKLVLYSEELLAPSSTLKLEDHPL